MKTLAQEIIEDLHQQKELQKEVISMILDFEDVEDVQKIKDYIIEIQKSE